METNQTYTSQHGNKSNIYKLTWKQIKHLQVNMETNQTSTSQHGTYQTDTCWCGNMENMEIMEIINIHCSL